MSSAHVKARLADTPGAALRSRCTEVVIICRGEHGLCKISACADCGVARIVNFDCIAEVAAEMGYIKAEDIRRLIAFRNNPSDESWIGA